ncbi:SCP2 sterol-binding domain-containing protein [Sulfobacillus acidophilus]|uniref:SCP2 sterol-binding domain-containing protein n=1 Tax=Sulfobacillus acidophilus TaxID=53633 RepID=A0ABS3AWE6_9FIRM|nr:SCP2 sterol-binding domain-containing protein [Sulfobacillus acidophilus]
MTTVSQVFDEMKNRLTPEKAQKINASYFFDIGGDNGGKWSVDLTKGDNWVTEGEPSDPAQCTIFVKKAEDWVALAAGKMNPTMAFMQGKIKVKGNMSLALKLQSLLS